ncbi:MAG: 3-keto-5-aminohexanoate cleavage protein [Lachnospiraceae bacterium]|jgi:3-keto-5-aminohexanoate cleavage enzyme|nr:3-keto-5-aminohexanoate cleavage protein [Lachnospiraceae bacterium]MDD4524917.1 3-keto-5-aminohexanoate cleavage protein [Lachnospiraceae bacterium]
MKKILVSVAPVSAGDKNIQPDRIADDVFRCYRAGAAMVHLHARDEHGTLTPDLTVLKRTVDLIREKCDIVIEISTGGVSDLTIEERCQPCFVPWVEANSLNVGSVNLGESVYCNPIKDVRFCVQQIIGNKKIAETELFEVGMANTLRELDEVYHFPKPMLIALVMGHDGEMPATRAGLDHLVSGVLDNFRKDDVIWGYTEAHRKNWNLMEYALEKGAGSVRIGFEDSDYLSPEKRVDHNYMLIEKAAEIIRSKGMDTMSPDEARKLLGITRNL